MGDISLLQNYARIITNDDIMMIKCDALQEKVTYVGKINFEFSTKLASGHIYQHVPEEYKAYCSIESEKWAYSVNFEKCTFEKITF